MLHNESPDNNLHLTLGCALNCAVDCISSWILFENKNEHYFCAYTDFLYFHLFVCSENVIILCRQYTSFIYNIAKNVSHNNLMAIKYDKIHNQESYYVKQLTTYFILFKILCCTLIQYTEHIDTITYFLLSQNTGNTGRHR